jgi:hypothetical protein
VASFFEGAERVVTGLSAKSDPAEAFRYTINQQEALTRFVTGRMSDRGNSFGAASTSRELATPATAKHQKQAADADVEKRVANERSYIDWNDHPRSHVSTNVENVNVSNIKSRKQQNFNQISRFKVMLESLQNHSDKH